MSIPEEPAAFADAAVRARWRDEKGMIVLKLWSDEHPRTPVDLFIHEPFSFPEELGARVAPGNFPWRVGSRGGIANAAGHETRRGPSRRT